MNIRNNSTSKVIFFLCSIYFILTPFEHYINAFSPTGSSVKYLGLILIGLILLKYYRLNISFKVYSYHVFLIMWIFYEILSILWTPPNPLFKGFFMTYTTTVLFYIILTGFDFTKKEVGVFINLTYYCSIFAALIVVLNPNLYHGVGIRYTLNIFGIEQDPNNVSAIIIPAFAIGIYKVISNKKWRILNFILIGVVVVALFMTGSRGGIVTLALLIIVSILLDNKKGFSYIKNVLLKSFSILIIVVIILRISTVFIDPLIMERLFNFDSYEGGSERSFIWKNAICHLQQTGLIFGNGWGSFSILSQQLFGNIKAMHNTFLTIFYENGIIGAGFFLMFLVSLLFRILRDKNCLALLVFISGCIPAIFIDAMNKRFLWTSLILVTLLIQKRQVEGKSYEKNIDS